MTSAGEDFAGAKLAVFLGQNLLVIQRDDRPDIPYPGHWDLPGGGREAGETPIACALRETREEVGLVLPPELLIWSRVYQRPHGRVWFFAAHLPAAAAGDVRFGDEGQGWALMAPEAYCAHPLAVPHFAVQLRRYLEACAG
ncbi:NUDIX hydrolase [Leisingera aquaemixtae]|jgi:8-oxo-dGTP diphosphatase|uniref:8-oxo-dGTP diphosphatase n=1 Tax=Leisingera aquaemixtae TaxID=1396826 RepID=A0A0P1HDU8_9RHOB|nr:MULTISPECIES: NUDIX hydrolase [Leisingera]QDI77357.1 NUDIX domain-containing protein [Leisingera aquaemixtae]UWQ24943.1 NUDIX hydrolase [Leisingera aquaemixtae]UWQ37491.1 NUDIX hydrolase [Leisingera aquaemixtae]UWQ41576.1 NUDIX hydrolase [Leisingera aquaemixtae]UWQ45839.1 NUDIX hydrolase [Leisingera aquaemixtae]